MSSKEPKTRYIEDDPQGLQRYRGDMTESGLTEAELRTYYPYNRNVTCGSETCQGDVSWKARIQRDADGAAVIDVCPGHDVCWACGIAIPEVWSERYK